MSTPAIDPIKFIEEKNQAQQALREGKIPEKPVAKVEEAKPDAEEEHQPRLPRSVRRELNKLREEAAEARGRLAAYEELGIGRNGAGAPTTGKTVAGATETDPEPQRSQFADDAAYNRALGRWDARQEAKKVVGETEKSAADLEQEKRWQAHLDAMFQKSVEDRKQFKDWDEVSEAAQDDEDAPKIPIDSQLMKLIQSSEFMAQILYHFAKHPAELQALLDVGEGAATIRNFGRLETKVEKLYSTQQEAAQASDKSKDESKDRTHPADGGTPGRTKALPRPSTEVAARGGSAPKSDITPAEDPAAWIAKRNAERGGR